MRDAATDSCERLLGDFAAGRELPAMEFLDEGEVPLPYRTLLAHDHGMTPTLEAHYGESMHLRVLAARGARGTFSRQVVLHLADGTPASFGAIRIELGHLPADVQSAITAGRQPMGTVLRKHGVTYSSRPTAYFRVRCDERLAAALDARADDRLYGRLTQLTDADGQDLAEVLEVLPAMEASS